MKLVSLNCWGGRRFQPLINFVSEQAPGTDIFCLQEVFDSQHIQAGKDRANLLDELKGRLPGFHCFFEATQHGFDNSRQPCDFPIGYGQATFVRNDFEPRYDKRYVFRKQDAGTSNGTGGRCVQWVTIQVDGRKLTVGNFHGLWNTNYRQDDDDRLSQSATLVKAMSGWPGTKILCGDFNLDPHTQSFRMLADGRRDLISEFAITTTRTELFDVPDAPFADYVLADPDISVSSFAVPELPISDHRPMLLEFSLP